MPGNRDKNTPSASGSKSTPVAQGKKNVPTATSNKGTPQTQNRPNTRSITSYMEPDTARMPQVEPVISDRQLLELMNGKLDTMRQEIMEEIDSLRNDYDMIREENVYLKTQIKQLVDKVDDLENRSRRDNIIVHGIIEGEDETWEESESAVKGFLKEKLELENIQIDRAHRLGKKLHGKTRPIIAKLGPKDKGKVMEKRFNVKGTPQFITEDFSQRVKQARKKLYEYSHKKEMVNAKIRYDKLFHAGRVYIYDEDSNAVKIIKQPVHPIVEDDSE